MHLERTSPDIYSELKRILKAENSRSADYSFANFVMWDNRFLPQSYICGDRLITLILRNDKPYFAFPVGSGDISPAFELMRGYCRENGIPFLLCGVCEEHLELINSAFPDSFTFTEDRDFSDYIYTAGSLSEYPGKHLHSKRNFCHRFEASHSWSFVPLTEKLIPDCIKMLDEWTAMSADRLTPDIIYERDAIDRGFLNFDALGLDGGVLYADGRLCGWSVGEMISDDTYCVHYEKAFSDIEGAYTMLCRESTRLALKAHPEMRYVNREDDMGSPALRKSKLSYKPEYILTKYIVSEK